MADIPQLCVRAGEPKVGGSKSRRQLDVTDGGKVGGAQAEGFHGFKCSC